MESSSYGLAQSRTLYRTQDEEARQLYRALFSRLATPVKPSWCRARLNSKLLAASQRVVKAGTGESAPS